MDKAKAIVLVSGGLDSVVLLYYYMALRYDVHVLTFDYGQKSKELTFLQNIKCPYRVVDLRTVFSYSEIKSALVSPTVSIPAGTNRQSTFVPNRNTIMLSIAWSWAITIKAAVVAAGSHAGDQFPDANKEAFRLLSMAFKESTKGFGGEDVSLALPFADLSKAAIVAWGKKLNVPFELTWSCFAGNDKQCGVCGACIHRKEAFKDAGVDDPTIYET